MPELVRTVGRYGILRELGRGGMAVVYLARQVDLDRLVALKELAAFHAADADFARRFVRESRLAGSLVHPNVITVFDYFEHDGTPYIAMEYVDRGSLRPYVGRMTIAQIGGVLEGLLAGLAEAEQHNIVHRDLKPENLMVTSTGTVKIADFGIAKATQAADTGAFVTATGTTVGTPPYMAPEQAMAKDVGPWTDLYSVGCMAYELFTGKPPFYDTDEPLAILLRHISEALPPASEVAGVDPEISAWIERLTAKEPKARPESATAAWEEFEEILIGKLGPRWRREARLPEPPNRGAEGASAPPTGADSDEYVSSRGAERRRCPARRLRRRPPGPRRRWRGSTSREPARTRAATCPPPRSRSTRPICHRRPGRRRSRGSTSRGPVRIPGATCRAARRRATSRTRRRPRRRPPDAAARATASCRGQAVAAGRPPASEQRSAPGPPTRRFRRQVILLASAGALALLARAADPAAEHVARSLERVRGPVRVRGGRCGPRDVDRRAGAAHGARLRVRRRRCADRVRQS